jgi:phosphatidylglycerol---prolipoprotein diacylglyceryl transferase
VHFPVDVPIGPLRLHPHVVFETLAYCIGFRIYLDKRRRQGDVIGDGPRWSIIAAAIAGAAIGSKVLYWFEDPIGTWQHLHDPVFLLQGKTIVGALIGGLIGVEATKLVLGVRAATGDLFAVPLAVGMSIGRVGCFLTGLSDRTYGVETTLPWGIDFGDHVIRHPTQLYEAFFLVVLAIALAAFTRRPHANGDVFKLFMVSYFAFRLLVDFLKPAARFAALSAIQWAAAGGLTYYAIYYARALRRWRDQVPGMTVEKVSTHGHA